MDDYPTIQIIGRYNPSVPLTSGFFMAGMPTEPPKPEPELPEFSFTEPVKFPDDLLTWNPRFHHDPVPVHYGPMAPPKPYIKGSKIEGLPEDELAWRHGRQFISKKPLQDHEMPPQGTVPALEGLARYFARMANFEAEWKQIAKTCCCDYHANGGTKPDHDRPETMEIPTVALELAQMGVSSTSLQSRREDDDEDDAAEAFLAPDPERIGVIAGDPIINHDARRYGTPFLTASLAPLVRRIEWERQARQQGVTQRAMLITDGEKIKFQPISRNLTDAQKIQMAKRLATTIQGRSPIDLANDQYRVQYYGAVGSLIYGVRKGTQHPIQSMNLLGAEDYEDNDSDGGPQELGLHNLQYHTAAFEPSESTLWPMGMDATQIHSPEEWDDFWEQIA